MTKVHRFHAETPWGRPGPLLRGAWEGPVLCRVMKMAYEECIPRTYLIWFPTKTEAILRLSNRPPQRRTLHRNRLSLREMRRAWKDPERTS